MGQADSKNLNLLFRSEVADLNRNTSTLELSLNLSKNQGQDLLRIINSSDYIYLGS